MKKLLLLIAFLTVDAFSADLKFKLKGEVIQSFTLEQLRSGEIETKSGKVRATEEKIFNVFRGTERIYSGYPFFQLMDAVYGKSWRTHKRIAYIAADGYNQFSSIAPLLKAAERKDGLLAYGEKGKDGFTSFEKEGKMVNPGPTYLVWKNFSDKDKASHADTLKWPYQMITISID